MVLLLCVPSERAKRGPMRSLRASSADDHCIIAIILTLLPA
jgi:hypothetical protein